MSLGSWFSGLIQAVITDFLFKRPVQITLQRTPDGKLNVQTQMTPSGAAPTTHVYYGQPAAQYYHPPGMLGAGQPFAPQGNPMMPQVMGTQPPPVAPNDPLAATLPEDFQAS
jgi:hypothetical protein